MMTARNIIKTMVNRGNTLLGVGCYSAALSSRVDASKAIKIGTDMEDPWLDYYNFVIKLLPDNDFTPKVYGFHYDDESDYYVCTMEKLSENPVGSKEDIKAARINASAIKAFLRFEIEIEDLWLTCSFNEYYFDQLKKVLLCIRGMTDVVTEEDKEEYGYNAKRLDIHDGNIMWRHDLPIVIDPWCHNEMDDREDLSTWADEQLADSPVHM